MKMASCVVGLLLTGAAYAQPVPPMQSLMEQLRQSEQAVTNARLQPENKGRLFGTLQTYGNVLSFAGDAEGAMAALDEGRKAAGVPVAGSAVEVAALTDVHAEDAIRAIVAAARDKRAVLLNQSRFVDMQVIFPDYGHQHGRPAWLIGLAGRTASPVPATLLPATGRRLVLAYDKAHGADALAVDAVLVQAGQPAPSLMLPPGEMRLETQE